jgi:hypothetical protein
VILSTLNFSDISLKFRTVAMFVIVDLQALFYMYFVLLSIIYVHTKFLIRRSNGPLLITIKLRANLKISHGRMLFYCLQKEANLNYLFSETGQMPGQR